MPNKTEILSADWITTAEAARIAGISERSIQKMGRDGRLKTRLAGRRDQPRMRVYDAEQIAELAKANLQFGAKTPVNKQEADQSVSVTRQTTRLNETVEAIKAFFREARLERQQEHAAEFLTISESATFLRLPKAYVKRAVDEGRLPAIKAGGWRIQRGKLETFTG